MSETSRREFLQAAAAGAVVWSMAGLVRAADEDAEDVEPVGLGVIGCGSQGKAVLRALAPLPKAPVKGVCDVYEGALPGAKKLAPEAETYTDHHALLANAAVQAVIIATPTHLHRQVVEDALAAGKHVYCEAPLAVTVEDALAIARAGKAAKTIFQAGIQNRTNPMVEHSIKFLKAGVLDRLLAVRAQWHVKDPWYRPSATPEREEQLNWRLRQASSAGILGELGTHQIELFSWVVGKRPVAVQATGGMLFWTDTQANGQAAVKREVADTALATFEYPGGLRVTHDLTLANSFDGIYTLFMGSNGTILLRDDRGWLFKEADAATLGWEVYATKESIGPQQGIVLIANATKLLAAGKMPHGEDLHKGPADTLTPALQGFLTSIREDEPPACGPAEGYEATVVGIRANEALRTGQRVVFEDGWHAL